MVCSKQESKTLNWIPNFKSKDSINYTFLSPISKEYLVRIKELSLNNDFKLLILPTSTKESEKLNLELINKDEFEIYFNSINYINVSCFYDNVHLKRPKEYRKLYKK